MNERERIAWAAGIVDGEGCIEIRRHINASGQRRYTTQIRVVMTESEAVEQLQAIFGAGTVNQYDRLDGVHVPYYCWYLGERDALRRVLYQLSEFLVTKRFQACMALALLLPENNLTDEHREDLYLEMRNQKCRARVA